MVSIERLFVGANQRTSYNSPISRERLIAYMKFLEENSTLFLATAHKAEQFTSNAIMSSFQDALEKSVIGKEIPRPKDANYKLQFVAAGIARLLIGWLQDAPREKKGRMADIILACIPA